MFSRGCDLTFDFIDTLLFFIKSDVADIEARKMNVVFL